MRYKIIATANGYRPVYRGFFGWRPLLDYMNRPAIFGTETAARLFITRAYCNWLNDTEGRRIKWGRGLEPRVKG